MVKGPLGLWWKDLFPSKGRHTCTHTHSIASRCPRPSKRKYSFDLRLDPLGCSAIRFSPHSHGIHCWMSLTDSQVTLSPFISTQQCQARHVPGSVLWCSIPMYHPESQLLLSNDLACVDCKASWGYSLSLNTDPPVGVVMAEIGIFPQILCLSLKF